MLKKFIYLADYAHSHSFLVKKSIKILLIGCFILWSSWSFVLKKPIYQRMYGTVDTTPLVIYNQENFSDITGQTSPALIRTASYEVQMTFLKHYQATSKIVYIDHYNFLGTWYRGNRFSYLYDKIAPLDVSTVSGKTASPNILKHFEFNHEYRLLWSQSKKWNELFVRDDINNNHIIPANKNIEKALEILNVGDTAQMSGYLVHLQGLAKDTDFEIKSALTIGEISKQKAGGQTTGLCRLIYLKKITFNGYTFE